MVREESELNLEELENEIMKKVEAKSEEKKVEESKTEEKEVKEEKKEIELEESKTEEKVGKEELIPIYVLSFELPSYALAIMDKDYSIDTQSKIITEVTKIEGELKAKIETLRRKFYQECDKLFETSTLGWVTVSEDGIKFAQEWQETFSKTLIEFAEKLIKSKIEKAENEELKVLYSKLYSKLIERSKRKIVRTIKVYLEPEDAKELLDEIVSRLNTEVEVLRQKVKEAEEKKEKRRIYNLNKELTVKSLKLEMFKKILDKIS